MFQPVYGKISRDIAKGLAIITLMFAAGVYVPFIGFLCTILIPLPVLFYRSKLGRQAGLIIPGLAIIVTILLLGNISIDLFLLIELMLLGFVLSEILELNLSIEKTILYSSCIVLFTGFTIVLFYCSMFDINPYAVISEYIIKNLELTIALYEDMGISEESLYIMSNAIDKLQYILVRIVPALIIAVTLFLIWTCILLSKPMLRAGKLFYPDFGSLNIWKAPEYLVWGVIVSGLMLLLPWNAFKILGINCIIILMVIYFFAGIAIVSFFFEKKGFPRILKSILYCMLALQQIILLLVIGLGFFDTWLNFRKL
ncbi:MAG: DUF2232 domain-containing protein [Deltaproteobacteria bacterium]|nr:DUF2232 domain-containing protein [Deltaproteobacteria bacterium]